jgi:hypothetical protein
MDANGVMRQRSGPHGAADGLAPVRWAIGTFYVHWDPLAAYDIETNEGFSREDPLQELGRLELKALGRVKHGDVPPATEE